MDIFERLFEEIVRTTPAPKATPKRVAGIRIKTLDGVRKRVVYYTDGMVRVMEV